MPIKDRLSKEGYKDFLTLKKYLGTFTDKAYLVGGAVRDLYLNNPIKDIDIEVYGLSPERFDEIMRDFGAVGVGKKFFVYKWRDFDISLPRVEKKVGKGHKAFVVELTNDEKEASKRRDFTMNALMIDIFSGKLLDFWGGKEDIKNKIIRVVDPKSFKEDSLRVLRAMQFAARFGFKCDKDSVEIMQGIALDDLSKERIFWEFEKLFNAKNLHIGAYYLFRLGIFEKLFGFGVKCRDFISISKEFLRYRERFSKKYYRFYFLYVVAKLLKRDILLFLEVIGAPKVYEKFYKTQPMPYKEISDRFILEVALRMPIKDWLESYKPEIVERAKRLGVYDKRLETGINAALVMKDGFEGAKISKEIKRREIEYIENVLKKGDRF